MKNLFTFFSRPRTYIVCATAFLLFGMLVLPWKSAQVALYTPESASFDTSLFYAPEEAARRVALYGDEGRASYVFDRWTFDLAFPAVYGAFMLSSWAFALARLGRKSKVDMPRLLAVPLLAVVFDLAENISVTAIMLAYPASPGIALYTAGASTLLKWIFVGAGFSGSLLLPLAALFSFLSQRQKNRHAASR